MARNLTHTLLAAGLIGCLVLAAAVPGQAASSPNSLRVRGVAAVQADGVRLGDVAEPLAGLNQERWSEMASQVFMQAPSSQGQRITVGRKQLKALLGRTFGRVVESFLLPNQLVLQRGGSVVTEQELTKEVVSFLRRKTQSFSGQVEFRELRLPEHIFLKRTDSSIECRATSRIKPGRNSLWIKAVGPRGDLENRFSGNVFIDIWRSVPCAARPLKRHEQLSPQAVTFERKNLAHLSYDIWDGQGGPWRMTRSVGTGQVLYSRSLEPVPLISRGDQITLRFKSEFIRLRVPALAMEDAGYGQTLRVRNLQSSKTIYATVEDANTVTVK